MIEVSKFQYGTCEICGYDLEPVWFIEEEYENCGGISVKTGRKRRGVSHLVCPICLTNHCVDDSFDGRWY